MFLKLVTLLAVVLLGARAQVPGVCEFNNVDPPPLEPAQQTSRGHPNGTLLVVGGGSTPQVIWDRFWDIAGGNMSRIVYIPTNGGGTFETPEQIANALRGLSTQTGWNLENLQLLHTRDRNVANTPEFARILDEATAVWMSGGRSYLSADSYGTFLDPTLTSRALEALLNRGGLFGGSSAGALIQSDFMLRGSRDSYPIPLWYGNALMEGFGFTHNMAFDVHLSQRRRNDDLNEVIAYRPTTLGVGIDESTGLVFKGDQFEVIGTYYATIHDATIWEDTCYCAWQMTLGTGRLRIPNCGKQFYLSSGDVYDVRTREVISTNYKSDPNVEGYVTSPTAIKQELNEARLRVEQLEKDLKAAEIRNAI